MTPLMIAPVHANIQVLTVAVNADRVGDHPLFGPASHFKRIAPGAWSFQIWNQFKRNQVLRHPLVKKWMARISLLKPQPGSIDSLSLVIYNKGLTLSTTDDVNYAIQQKIPHGTLAVVSIAQFVNATTEQAEQKWLLCFNSAEKATIFYERKQWV